MLKLKYGDGKYLILLDDNQLRNMDGAQENIRPQSAQILRIAVQKRETPVSLKQFQEEMWPETKDSFPLPELNTAWKDAYFGGPWSSLKKAIASLDPDAENFLRYKSGYLTSYFAVENFDEKLKNLSNKIVKGIWDRNKNMGIRDDNLNRSKHGEQLCDLYVVPGFCYNNEPIEEALFNLIKQGIQRMIIEAPSGYGKTSLAQAISLCCTYKEYRQLTDDEKAADEEAKKQRKYYALSSALGITDGYFPVFIDSSDVKLYLSEGSIITILYKSLALSKHVIEEASFKDFLENFDTKLLLIIDGYDEIEKRETFNNCLKAVFEELPNAKIIMTTRPMAGDSYEDIAKDFARITIRGVQGDEVRQKCLIAQYLQYKMECGTMEIRTDTLAYYTKWSCNDYFKPFMESPYLLTQMLTKDKDKNAKPIDIVTHIVSALLRRYSDQTKRDGLPSEESRVVELIFSSIAYQMLLEDEESILIEDFPARFRAATKKVIQLCETATKEFKTLLDMDCENIINKLSDRVDDYISLINVRSGLLIPENGRYFFQIGNITKLFLASKWIETMTMATITDDDIRTQRYGVSARIHSWFDAINHPYRKEVLLMYITLLGTDEQLLKCYDNEDRRGELVTIVLDYVTSVYISITNHEDLVEYSSLLVKLLIDYFGANGVTKANKGDIRDYYDEDDISPKYEDILLRTVINSVSEHDYEQIVSLYQPNLNEAYRNRIDSLRKKGMILR